MSDRPELAAIKAKFSALADEEIDLSVRLGLLFARPQTRSVRAPNEATVFGDIGGARDSIGVRLPARSLA